MRTQFSVYIDWHKNIQKFTIEEKALLLDKLYAFYMNHEVDDVPEDMVRLNVFWDSILPFMIKAEDAYQQSKKNRQAGVKKAIEKNPKIQKARQADIAVPDKRVSTSTSTSTLTSTSAETETSTSTLASTKTETATRPTSLTGAITQTLKEIESSILTPEFVAEQLNKGITAEELKAKYPHSASVITDVYFDL